MRFEKLSFTSLLRFFYSVIVDCLKSKINICICALSSKMLLVRIVENNKIDAYFRAGRLSKG